MIRLPRSATGSAASVWLPLVAVSVSGVLYGYASAFLMLSNLWHADGLAVFWNGVLLGILAVGVIAWTLAVSRAWVSASTGAGLVLAACALALCVHCEFSVCLFPTPLEDQLAGHRLVTLVAWIRPVSWGAFGFGLATTTMACLQEQRA